MQIVERYPPEAMQLYGAAFRRLRDYFLGIGQEDVPLEEAARAIAHALTARRPKNTYFVGPDAWRVGILQMVAHGRLRDQVIMRTIGLNGGAEPAPLAELQ